MLSSIHLKMREAEVGMLMFVVCFGGRGILLTARKGSSSVWGVGVYVYGGGR